MCDFVVEDGAHGGDDADAADVEEDRFGRGRGRWGGCGRHLGDGGGLCLGGVLSLRAALESVASGRLIVFVLRGECYGRHFEDVKL